MHQSVSESDHVVPGFGGFESNLEYWFYGRMEMPLSARFTIMIQVCLGQTAATVLYFIMYGIY